MANTEQQQNTIDAPLGNILVCAAAGSGKTSVMTDRIVKRILIGELDIRNVLVMTFTDAAAKSMREKIDLKLRAAIADFGKESQEQNQDNTISNKKNLLAKQLAYLGQSSISTIHAFCLDVVRNFYYEVTDLNGKILLEPGFRIEEQGEAEILLAKALEDLFEKYYTRCDTNPDTQFTKDFLFLIDSYGSQKDDAPVRKLVLGFYRFLRSMPDYNGWIKSQNDLIARTIMEFDHSKCFKTLYKGLVLRVQKAEEGMDELKDILSGYPDLYKDKKKNQQALSDFSDFIRYMDDVIRTTKNENIGWDDLYDVFQTKPQIPNLRKTKSDSEEKLVFMELFDNTFAELLYYISGEFGTAKYESQFVFAKCFVFTKPRDEIVNELVTMQPAIIQFFEILTDLDEEYTKAKLMANMIDFGDFEHMALKILKTPVAGKYYRDKYTEIYLDEYQDTSSIQEALLQQISKGNCFMVGDVKQSIYKFRHARPQIFMGKRESFTPACNITGNGNGNGNATGTIYELSKNFRSVKGILDAVNDVFFQLMSLKAGEIDYEDGHSLAHFHENTNNNSTPVEILLVDISQEPYATSTLSNKEIPNTKDTTNTNDTEDAGDTKRAKDADNKGSDSMCSEEFESQDDEQENSDVGCEIPQEELLSKDETTKYEKEALIVALKIKELLGISFEIEINEAVGNESESVKTSQLREEESEDINVESNDIKIEPREEESADIRIDHKGKKIEPMGKESKEKKITPGSIAILARTKSICAVFAKTIESFGFPVEQEQSEAFLERYELKVIEALLIILDNPMQDIPLVSVMRSPLFKGGFSEEELLSIKISSRETKYFYECCELYAEQGQDNDLKEKLCEFYIWLKHFRDRLAYQSVSELIETVYVETGFLAYASAMPDGTQRVLSLQQFQDWARGFDQSRQAGLYSFVRYMEEIHEKTQGQSPFSIEQSQTDSIKVMTMHKSKGLEYEVVFIVGNNRKMTSKDTQDAILVSEEFGVGFHYVDVIQQFKYPTPLVFAMREGMRNAELAEEMRLLYVGMTRAQGRLFITGTCSNKDFESGKGLAALIDRVRKTPSGLPLPPHVALSAKSTLEWIVMSIARNPNVDLAPLSIIQSHEESDNETGEIQTYTKDDNEIDLTAKKRNCNMDINDEETENIYNHKRDDNEINFSDDKTDCNIDINKADEDKRISEETHFYSKSWCIKVEGYGDILKKAQEILQNQGINENADKYSSERSIKSNNDAFNTSNEKSGNMSIGINGNMSNKICGDIPNGTSGKISNEISGETVLASYGLSEEMANQLYNARFVQEYPFEKATSTPLKISVSEIKRREQEQLQDQNQVQIKLPATFETVVQNQEIKETCSESVNQTQEINEPISPFRSINTTMKDLTQTTKTTLEQREIGITVHSFFRYMDIKLLMQNPTPENIAKHMDRMLEMGMLQQLEHSYLLKYTSEFEGYLKSSLARRIYEAENRGSKYLFREIPFTIKLDCKSLFGEQGFAPEDATFVQGMIDCWFIEDGKAVLVDYKTDMIKGDENQTRQKLEQHYSKQLSIYAQAITNITGLEVKESIIWLVDSAKEFHII